MITASWSKEVETQDNRFRLITLREIMEAIKASDFVAVGSNLMVLRVSDFVKQLPDYSSYAIATSITALQRQHAVNEGPSVHSCVGQLPNLEHIDE